ncbi:MAG: M3 family oligoendopeptidase [Microthrixaceae bacterium]
MTATEAPTDPTGAEQVAWDIESLVDGGGPDAALALFDRALADGAALTAGAKGTIASADAAGVAAVMDRLAAIHELVQRVGSYASLRFSTDVADPASGALLAKVQELGAQLAGELVWVELEWLALDDDHAKGLLEEEALARHRHHLEAARLGKPHALTEPEEKVLAAKRPTSAAAWARLFTEQAAAIQVDTEAGTVGLETALSALHGADRAERAAAHDAVTRALAPGLRTRAFIFNTLLADKAAEDSLRSYPSWITSWNQSNQASDASVQALVDAVVARYDIPQRWYALKGRILGVDPLTDYDRYASVADAEAHVPWDDACRIVRNAYASFSTDLADIVDRFLDEGWIDAPVRPNKRGGAFCDYTSPEHHPYVMLNYTATSNDVMTLAHELGHGVHGYLARPQGVFHQATPLTLAETASVFGETVTFEALLGELEAPDERFALLARNVEGNIATVFRQVSMNRFEHAVHTHRRDVGELSVDDFNEHWAATQGELFGPGMEVTEGYRSWWSYIPHFIGAPGYVYAYAYGQLLALSVYANYQRRGANFVPQYLELLTAGGSRWPEELGRIVDCDLTDPGFWASGLELISSTLDRAEAEAKAANRI